MSRVLVIGGGAAGLTASIYARKNGNEVTIIEKNNSLGKKILVTGNGKCNLFNNDFTSKHYMSENNDLIDQVITSDNKRKILSFFDEIGIVTRMKDGCYYPYSNQAVSIQNTLITEVNSRNIKVITNTTVLNVKYQDKEFIVSTDNGDYKADKVILATGSKAFYNTEIEDIGYKIALYFEHNIVKVLPALVQLKALGSYFKDWNGIRTDCKVSLYNDTNLIRTEVGEIQLTNYGVSGICVLQLSNQAVRMLDNGYKPYLMINFLSYLNINTKEEFITYFKNRNNRLKGRNVSELFDTILNYKLTNVILKLSKIDSNKNFNNLNDNELYTLANNMINFRLNIIDSNDFREAQVCSGGISLNEINLNTMESIYQKGLYICGELLDITGDCGGYNLGFAWLSGILAGSSIKGE